MSSTNRGSERRIDDAYMTPGWCVRRLLEVWTPRPGLFVEPSVGDGAIVAEVGCTNWLTYDVRDVQPPPNAAHEKRDFLSLSTSNADARTVITNPPFSLAEEFVRKSRELFPSAELVFLLRLAFLASEKRSQLWKDIGQPDVFVLPNRPSFTGGGTDSTDYAWFVWPEVKREAGILRVLNVTPASERKP